MFIGATTLCAALNQPLQTCPEVLSTIYTAHYRHVLRVCRRFFRQPEDAEDATAEVFLKLHRALETKDEAVPFRPWVSRVAARHCIDKLHHPLLGPSGNDRSRRESPPARHDVNILAKPTRPEQLRSAIATQAAFLP